MEYMVLYEMTRTTVLVEKETTTMGNTEDLYFKEGCSNLNKIIIRVFWTMI